jgi:NAD(P)-dependent dehydrogenase (short-subunit alcohol dehydrogenase family)
MENQMKTVLITGCSSGIGFATAVEFARKGFKVIATMRNLENAKALQKISIEEKIQVDIRQLDVTQDHSIQLFVKNILEKYKTIDVLINNAGAGLLSTLEQTSLSQAREIMDANFFGTWNMTKAVLPSMRAKKSGRIISVTSIGGVIGQPFNDAYCAAKFAVEGMMESLAPVVKRLGIDVSLVEPGPVNSAFVSSTLNKSSELSNDLESDYRTMLDAYSQATEVAYSQFAQSSDEIAKIILDIAIEQSPSFRYQTSEVSKKIASIKLVDPTGNQVIALAGSRLPTIERVI